MAVGSYQPQINLTAYEAPARQRRILRTLLAVAVLAGFAFVLVKYRDSIRLTLLGTSNQARVSTSDTATEKASRVTPARSRRTGSTRRSDSVVPQTADDPDAAESTFRQPTVVEVIYGTGQRQWIRTRDDSIYLDLRKKSLAAHGMGDAKPGFGSGVINASEQVPLPSAAVAPAPPAAGSADPLLAKQQTVEGSVVFLARIDKEGNIHNLQIVSGPESLYGAAREAVRQWRFKPYYQSGHAVETDAQITVKFAIAAQ